MTYTKGGFEAEADTIKVAILVGLVRDGLLSEEQADTWAASHTIILRKKSIFQTITNAWKNKSETDGYYYKIVHDNSGMYMKKDDEK